MTTPNQPRTSRLAIVAMILGIAAIPLALPVVGVLAGIAAIILGIAAARQINANPASLGGRGFARTGVICGILSFPVAVLVVLLFIPMIQRSNDLADRVACARNLMRLGQAQMIYATENGSFPTVPPLPLADGQIAFVAPTGLPQVPAAPVSHSQPNNPAHTDPNHPDRGSITAVLWKLAPYALPKTYVCPADPFASRDPAPANTPAGEPLATPAGPQFLSYSTLAPWRVDNGIVRPATGRFMSLPASAPIFSDIAPLAGTGNPARALQTPPSSPAAANSPNHRGHGQNITYSDGHVAFETSPSLPHNAENIWTVNEDNNGWNGTPPQPGRYPNPKIDPNDRYGFDALMIPVRNLNTGELQ